MIPVGFQSRVDVSDDTMTMDPNAIEAAITPRTVGLVPVHLYGHPAEMDAILSIAAKHIVREGGKRTGGRTERR